MRILICNERFLFRFGVDRVLLMLGSYWKKAGHEIVFMGNKLDPMAVDKCSDRFIPIPEAPDYLHGNYYTEEYIKEHWDEWFDETNKPDIALVAGWPFYRSIGLLREKCGCAFFHDYGAVPTEGMSEPQVVTQNELRRLRKENLKLANKIVAISSFLEETQSKPDAAGVIATSYSHLGVDHIVMNLWDSNELGIEENDVITNIEKYKSQGYKIIFQPGRWETGNYKNSPASYDIAKKLIGHGHKFKILVLANDKDLNDMPDKLKDCYYCLGFIDDATMRKAMELSDLGFSPTTWEGFDLPLGEMQYLDKCMYVLNIGAHPEVAANPYFLCENVEEIADKIHKQFIGKLPFNDEELSELFAGYREIFTWQNSADELLEEMKNIVMASRILFVDVTNACHDTANSGVMRVTRKISNYIQKKFETVFIMWDASIKKFVFPYPAEVELLCSYGGPVKEKIKYRSIDGQPRRLLDEVIGTWNNKKKYHLFTETVNSEILRETIPYFHDKNVHVAAVFYDAIAILRPELVNEEVSKNHGKYMNAISECELVMPIASHNQEHLEEYWCNNGITSNAITKTVDLAAEMDKLERNMNKITSVDMDDIKILFVSTLEPRKNHIRFLKAVELLFKKNPRLKKKITVDLVGNRYAQNTEIPKFVQEFSKKYPNVKWHGVVSDEVLRELYSGCTFTAYPSEIEGFGMPIVESLWVGKPCLCNNEGSIGELGAKGGCYLTDVLDINEIEKALYELVTNEDKLIELQNEAVERDITTWDEYVDNISNLLIDLSVDFSEYSTKKLALDVRMQLNDWLSEHNGKKIIICSNYYPPNFIGGAEVIAHRQALSMTSEGIADVLTVSLDVTGRFAPGTSYLEYTDGIPVIRICVNGGKNFNANGINFFDEHINSIFDDICNYVNPDVVHCHNIIGMSLGLIDVAKKYGARVCVTLHDNWGFCYKNTVLDNHQELCTNVFECEKCLKALTADGMHIPMGVRRSYFRRMFEKIDEYISPSRYLANSYLRAGYSYHKMNVIWNGIDVGHFVGIKKVPSEKLRITFVGYFGAHKGIDLLIKAVGSLGNKDIEINLVGAGDQQENYKKIAAECGALHQLRFWGKMPNDLVINAYAETDIYCLPSIWPENQPVSITEAMICGIPVIASDLGGNVELVNDGVTGFLFKAGDYKNLADKIKQFVDDRTLLKRMGKEGRKVMLAHDFSDQVQILENLYTKEYSNGAKHSKNVIAVKGNRLPAVINQVTVHDIMLMDWIISNQDKSDICAYIVLPGQKLSKKELAQIKASEKPVYVEDALYAEFKKKGYNVRAYSSETHLLELVSKI